MRSLPIYRRSWGMETKKHCPVNRDRNTDIVLKTLNISLNWTGLAQFRFHHMFIMWCFIWGILTILKYKHLTSTWMVLFIWGHIIYIYIYVYRYKYMKELMQIVYSLQLTLQRCFFAPCWQTDVIFINIAAHVLYNSSLLNTVCVTEMQTFCFA